MTYAESIATILQADTALMALLTGGVYVYEDAGRKGINRVELVKAFSEQTGIIKPMLIIYEAQDIPDHQAYNPVTHFQTTRVPIMMWIYDEGEQGYATIDAAYQLVYLDVDNKQIPLAFQAMYAGALKNKREPLLNDACYYQVNFNVEAYLGA